MFKEASFSRKVLNAYTKFMNGLSEYGSTIDENEHVDLFDRLNWDNKLVSRHRAGGNVVGLLRPRQTARNIVDEADGKNVSWERISRRLEVDVARKRGVLELLRMAAMESALNEANFEDYNATWEAAVAEQIINIKNVTRIRSRVQANFYLRSANRTHRILGRMYLAKNDNFTSDVFGVAA